MDLRVVNKARPGDHVPLPRNPTPAPATPEPVLRRERARLAHAAKGHRDLAAWHRQEEKKAPAPDAKAKKGEASAEETPHLKMAETHEAIAAELEGKAAALK